MVERRRFPRYEYAYKVLYKNGQGLSWNNQAYTENVSRSGLRMHVHKLIEEGRLLTLKIFNPSIKEPIKVSAKVVWTAKNGAGKYSGRMGLAFTHVGWTDSEKLIS